MAASPSRRQSVLLGGLLVGGALLRFPTLAEQSFWYDEAVTHGIVAHGLGHVLSSVAGTESTPPLYYVLVWFWSRVLGLGEAGLRSFSALCGTATILVVWALGHRLVSERVGLIAGCLTAINPLLIWYSQEARSYALATLLSTLALLALVRALERPARGRLLAWSLTAALALCSHYFAALVLAPQAAWLIASLMRRHEPSATRALLAFAPVAAVSAALLPLLVRQADGRASFIAASGVSLPARLSSTAKQDIVGVAGPAQLVLSRVGAALLALGIVLWLTRTSGRERREAILPAVLGAGAVALAALSALVATDYVDPRNLLPSLPAFVLLAGVVFGAPAAGRLGALVLGALGCLQLVCVAGVVLDPAYQREDWRGSARALGRPLAPRALVSGNVAYGALLPYLHGIASFPPAGVPLQEVDVISLDRGTFATRGAERFHPPLAGFRLARRLQTRSYLVLRYRAPAPRLEPPGALTALAPDQRYGLVLLQRP